MRLLLQRVNQARVTVADQQLAEIGTGILALVGLIRGDDRQIAGQMADKMLHLRMFADGKGKMNRSLLDIQGQLLLVPQFTLAAGLSRGRRPDFDSAMPPAQARPLYSYFVETAGSMAEGARVSSGQFGAEMQVALINDGPVTFMLDSDAL